MSEATRAVLRWHGGKWRLAPWIVAHFPPHRVYVEPYGGAASVLLRKPRCYSEVYNDLDDEVVHLFRVLRDPDLAPRLIEALRLTPFARAEFEASYEVSTEPVERARRLVVRSFMGHGADGTTSPYRTGFRSNALKRGSPPQRDWTNYPEGLAITVERLREVIVENRDALDVIGKYDSPETLHYVDPPYVWETRSRLDRKPDGGNYRHELTDEQHRTLLATLRGLEGMVVLSGYATEMYDETLAGWLRVEREALADGGRKRVEVLWINPAAAARMQGKDLFESAA